jgi:pimeloyl-ACP methyl ester carboxylesterase
MKAGLSSLHTIATLAERYGERCGGPVILAGLVVGQPAVLVGHSLGGLVALSCGAFFPGWVLAVVAAPLPDPALLAGALPRRRRRPWRRRLKRSLVVLLCHLLPLELVLPLLIRSPLLSLAIQLAYRRPVLNDRDLWRLIAQPARRPGAVPTLRAMSIAMALRPRHATAPVLLPRVRAPLLLIWGRQDRLVPLEVAHQCRRLRGDLSLVVLDGAGHCAHDDVPEAWNATLLPLMLRWLESAAWTATPPVMPGGPAMPASSTFRVACSVPTSPTPV